MLDVVSAPIVTELPRIEGRAAPPVPEPVPSVDELSMDAELRGVKVRAGARGAGIAALQRVLIVLIVVAGAAGGGKKFSVPPPAPPQPNPPPRAPPPPPPGARARGAPPPSWP